MKKSLVLTGDGLTIEQVREVALSSEIHVQIADSARAKMADSRSYIEGRIAKGEVMYGVNTGFGAFSSVQISEGEIEELQRNLIRSHSAGVGSPFSIPETRAIMLLRANALADTHRIY